jgi:hypothetical protein
MKEMAISVRRCSSLRHSRGRAREVNELRPRSLSECGVTQKDDETVPHDPPEDQACSPPRPGKVTNPAPRSQGSLSAALAALEDRSRSPPHAIWPVGEPHEPDKAQAQKQEREHRPTREYSGAFGIPRYRTS